MLRKLIVVALLICCSIAAVAQTKPRLAILPITGGSGDDGETIAELFSFEPEIERVFVRIPRTSSIDSIMKEQQFQRSTGLTDSDTIARLGRQLNADYVVAGHIQVLGENKLIIITIIHVESLQQIAGDYREYKTIEEIQGMIPDMARRIARTAQINRANLPKLAVLPFATPASGVNQSDAEVLAQLLATDIANSGKYTVLPRTSQIQAVMKEHEIQRSDLTEASSIKAIGEALNAQYVLAGNVRRLGQVNMFTVQILEVENGSILVGNYENYNSIADGLTAMATLSGKLTGVTTQTSGTAATTPTPTPTATAVNTPAVATANNSQSANNIILPTASWQSNKDNSSSSRVNASRENINGQEWDVLVIAINLVGGTSRWAGVAMSGSDPCVPKLRVGSGVRFKILGDGKSWELQLPTNEVKDSAFFYQRFTTRQGVVTEINIPYSQLRQPSDWGTKVRFNKNSITGISIQRTNNTQGGTGASTIKIFDFEIY